MARKTDSFLRLAGIIALGYFLLTKAGNAIANRISIGRPRLRIHRITGMGVEITFILPIVNATPVSAPIDALSGNILYGSNILSNVVLNRSVTIAANNSTDLNLNATLDFSQLTGSIASIIQSQDWLQSLRFKGQAMSNGVVFPFDRTFQVGL